jgi:hypothetical protein
VPFSTSLASRRPQTSVVVTSTPTTVDVVAPHGLARHGEATRLLDHNQRQSPAVRPLGRALEVIADLGALVLTVWLIPIVILAIASPIVLILWAALALIHRL